MYIGEIMKRKTFSVNQMLIIIRYVPFTRKCGLGKKYGTHNFEYKYDKEQPQGSNADK